MPLGPQTCWAGITLWFHTWRKASGLFLSSYLALWAPAGWCGAGVYWPSSTAQARTGTCGTAGKPPAARHSLELHVESERGRQETTDVGKKKKKRKKYIFNRFYRAINTSKPTTTDHELQPLTFRRVEENKRERGTTSSYWLCSSTCERRENPELKPAVIHHITPNSAENNVGFALHLFCFLQYFL